VNGVLKVLNKGQNYIRVEEEIFSKCIRKGDRVNDDLGGLQRQSLPQYFAKTGDMAYISHHRDIIAMMNVLRLLMI